MNFLARLKKKPAAKTHEAVIETPRGRVTVKAKRNRRARRMTLRIDATHDCAILVLPTYVALAEGLDFARSKADWLQAKLAELPERLAFADGALLQVLGRRVTIRHEPGLGARVTEENGELRVGGDTSLLRGRVLRWLKAEARRAILPLAAERAALLGKKHKRVTLRDSRSRWGSCSSDGSLSFCWRLVFAPPAVLDYVVSHEVAHLIEMNHGPRFWELVERLTPHREAARRWLAENGAALQRQG
jgi:predicted metal-dependent hydrolase